MPQTVRVNFHRHSSRSDGLLSPERLAGALADAGAVAVALTDHDTTEGLQAFEHELAAREVGPAPLRFCFLAMGGEGRGEQTLVTDQDNAILYENPPDEETARRAGEYFAQLGGKACGWLAEAGYARCRGEVMASNPRWRRPLAAWERQFAEWITGATPQDLLEFNMFFDFRCVAGERELARALRRSIQAVMDDCPPFFLHFAQNALLYKPPIGLFGQIVTESGGQNPHTFNIKEATLPVVNFARLYALRHRVEDTNTLDRLQRLLERQALKPAFHKEIVDAYPFLMQLRLNHQAAAFSEDRAPDNFINPKTLTPMEEALLKQAFGVISAIRKKISYDFQGMA